MLLVCLGTVLTPKGVPGTPGDEKGSKTDELDPTRYPVGRLDLHFLSISWFLSRCFLSVVVAALWILF